MDKDDDSSDTEFGVLSNTTFHLPATFVRPRPRHQERSPYYQGYSLRSRGEFSYGRRNAGVSDGRCACGSKYDPPTLFMGTTLYLWCLSCNISYDAKVDVEDELYSV